MGCAVLHLEKAKGADSKMSAHIERTSHPKNADETRTHLNRELVQFPEGVNNRTEAIAHRIGNAGIKLTSMAATLSSIQKSMPALKAEPVMPTSPV